MHQSTSLNPITAASVKYKMNEIRISKGKYSQMKMLLYIYASSIFGCKGLKIRVIKGLNLSFNA